MDNEYQMEEDQHNVPDNSGDITPLDFLYSTLLEKYIYIYSN